MEFKIGDLVKVKDCDKTRLLEDIGMIKVGEIGKIVDTSNFSGDIWHYIKYDEDIKLTPEVWLEPIIDNEPEIVDGVKIQIVYNGFDLNIMSEDGVKIDINDKYINALYGVIDALYDLIGVKIND